MTSASLELQKAIFETLYYNDNLTRMIGEKKIFDSVPFDTTFPYICFGKISLYDWSSDCGLGFEHIFTIHIWSSLKGKKETFEIAEIVKSCLHDQKFDLDEHYLISISLTLSEIGYDNLASLHHGVLRFRIVTQKKN